MLDPFLFAHHELDTMEPKGEKLRFLEDTFARAITFARFPVALPTSYHLLLTGHVQTHEKIFELHISTTNVPYMIRLTPIERLLFEIIMLHKLQIHFERENTTDRERRSLVVLGCMMQHRLTRLLVDIHPNELNQIFQLGRSAGMDRNLWETHFVGAAACARTISSLLELGEGRVFLPTVFEDCMLGIDLILLNPERDNWCISVKSGRAHETLHISHVHTRPNDKDTSVHAANHRRIFDGAHDMEELYDGTFRACRVTVGRTNGKMFDLNVYDEDVNHLRRFLRTDRSRPFIPHSHVSNSNANTLTDAA